MHKYKNFASLYAIISSLLARAYADSGTVWDYAPDFSHDQIQPYPSLKNPDGSNVTIENLRGIRLFGFKGCSNHNANAIDVAYNDFYKLANQEEVYNQISWDDQVSAF